MVAGVKRAIDEHGNRVGAYTVTLAEGDVPAFYDGPECQARGQRYAQNPRIVAVIGTDRGPCAAYLVPALNRAGLAAISPTEATPGLTHEVPGHASIPDCYQCSPSFYPTGVRNYLRVVSTIDSEGRAAARLLFSLGSRRAFIVTNGEGFNTAWIALAFAAEARRIGLRVVGEAAYTPFFVPTYGSVAKRAISARADAMLLMAPTLHDGSRVLKAVKAAGFQGRIVSSLSITELVAGGSLMPHEPMFGPRESQVNGVFFTWNQLPLEALPKTARDFVTRLGIDDNATDAVYAAEATNVLLDAIEASDGTRPGIRDQLFRVRRNGLLGRISFDANGDVQPQRIAIFRARGGRPVFLHTVTLHAN
jgi:ABC-type branched-subunit amino acid transport system substrate-binding protein